MNLVVKSFVLRIREKLLQFDLKWNAHLDEASDAFSDGLAIDLGADQNTVVEGLHPQVDVQLGTLRNADDSVAEIPGNGDVELSLPHLARAVQKIEHLDGVGQFHVV